MDNKLMYVIYPVVIGLVIASLIYPVNVGLPLTYTLFAIAAIAAVLFPVKYMAQNIKEAKGAFVGVGFLVAVFLVSYLLAPADFHFPGIENYVSGPNTVKLVGTGLNAFGLLLGIGIISLVYFEVMKLVK